MEEVTGEAATVGEQLRAARERQGITLEDVAARTRIPTRHLQSLEESAWDRLPAPTYSIGFAKSYATVVGLERNDIGDALRAEMGTTTLAARPEAQVFEPADPAKVMPRWLVLVALLALAASLLAGPLRRLLKHYVWMTFAAGFGQTPWSVAGVLAVLGLCAAAIFWQIGGHAEGGRYPAGIFSAYAAGIGLLVAQTLLCRTLEREPDVRRLIER